MVHVKKYMFRHLQNQPGKQSWDIEEDLSFYALVHFGGPDRLGKGLTYSVKGSKKRIKPREGTMIESELEVFFPARTAYVMEKVG